MNLLEKIEWPPAGRYVVAVSGGVDSMALWDLLSRSNRGYELVAAYFDHGWRDTTAEWELVQKLGASSSVVRTRGLEPVAKSEAAARRARYEALESVRQERGAAAVVTAQHQDDLIETVVLNVLRGSGRRGLSPMMDREQVLRPLLGVRKAELVAYAQERGLTWIEDPTNVDTRYRRNWVRHELLPKLRRKNPQFDHSLLDYITEAHQLNRTVNRELISLVHTKEGLDGRRVSIQPALVRQLPIEVLQELLLTMAYMADPDAEIDGRTMEHLAVDLKCTRLSRPRQLGQRLFAEATHDTVAIAFKAR